MGVVGVRCDCLITKFPPARGSVNCSSRQPVPGECVHLLLGDHLWVTPANLSTELGLTTIRDAPLQELGV